MPLPKRKRSVAVVPQESPVLQEHEGVHAASPAEIPEPDIEPELSPEIEPPAGEPALGRRPLAQSLAERIRAHAHLEESFFLHIDGVAGAGKSSFLDLLQDELRPAGSPALDWHVVRLDAPRITANGPLWWSVMDAVFRGIHASVRKEASIRKRASRIWWSEYAWRFAASHGALYFGLSLASFLILLLPQVSEFQIPVLVQLVAAVIALGALYLGFKESLLVRPRPGGKGGHVDLEDVSAHFGALFKRSGARVALFLDDLEQCDAGSAPALLKTCSALFKELPVAVVVTADRRWLLHTFDSGDGSLSAAAEPGRSAGYLMLSRLFQLSVTLPRVPLRTVARYWETLLSGGRDVKETPFPAIASPTLPVLEEPVLHGLARVMDQNPQTMKRFMDAHPMMRLIMAQTGYKISPVQVAGWTILCLRWPLLAEYLAERPKEVAHFRYDTPPSEVPDLIRGLFLRPQVVAIMRGLTPGTAFDERVIQAFTEPFNNGGSLLGVA